LNLGRLLVEVEAYEEATEVLEGLEDEDDEEFEVLYLLGLVNWLMAEKESDASAKKELYIDCREVLERFLQVGSTVVGKPFATDMACRYTRKSQIIVILRCWSRCKSMYRS
jgi:hypothetical protein